MTCRDSNLIWLDLEMTGLEPEHDVILEIATIITDSQLNILAQGPVFAIHQTDNVLDNMNPWCIEQHGKSGLTQRCQQSQVSLDKATQENASSAGATNSIAQEVNSIAQKVVEHTNDKEFEGKSQAGAYGDFMVQTDWVAGQVIDALKKNGLDDNTLVIFTSDIIGFVVCF